MPSYIMHGYFAEQAEKLFSDRTKKWISADRGAYMVGAQGPDLMFYLRYSKPPVNTLGKRMHEADNQDDFFMRSALYAAEKDSPSLYSFIMGQLCHYALDSVLHPYIYFREKDLPAFYPEEARPNIHVIYESGLDFMCLKEFMKKEPLMFRGAGRLRISERALGEASKYYEKVAGPLYDTPIKAVTARSAIRRMFVFMSLCDDPFNIKYGLVRTAEKLAGQPRGMTAFFRPRTENVAEDWLNHTHKAFPVSRNRNETESCTVEELIDRALKKAAALEADFIAMTNGAQPDKSLYTVSYSGMEREDKQRQSKIA